MHNVRLMKHPQTYSVNHPEPLLSSTESFFIFLSGLKWTENCYCDVNFWFVRMTSVCLLSGCSYVNVYIKMHIHNTVILCKLIMVFRNKRKRLDISDSDLRHTVFLTFLTTTHWCGFSVRFAATSVVLLALFCVRWMNSQEPWPKIQSSKIHKNYP